MKIYKVTSKQYTSLINNGSITVNGVIYTYDPNSLYSIVDQAQDEYTLAYDQESSHLQLNKNGDIHSDISCEDMLVGHAKNADHAASLKYGQKFLTANEITTDLNNKLNKVMDATGLQAYTTNTNGVQSTLSITDTPGVGFIPKYNSNKSITVESTPTATTDAVSKYYVDNQLKNYATTTDLNNKYTKPSGGIPKTDLASAVRTSLNKADTALQSHQTVKLATGTNNGTVKLTVGSTTTDNIAVKGLKSAAYQETTRYLGPSSTHNTLSTSRAIYNYLSKDFRLSSNNKYWVTANRVNKLSCLPVQCVIIEKSTDAGITWVDAEISDDQKQSLFSDQNANIILPKKDGKQSLDCMLRITITPQIFNVPEGTPETEKYSYWTAENWVEQNRYFTTNFIYIWETTTDNYMSIQVYKAMGNAMDTWTPITTTTAKNWPGATSLVIDETALGGWKTQTSQPWAFRFVFRTASGRDQQLQPLYDESKLVDSSNNQIIYLIKMYGDNNYGNSYLTSDNIGYVDSNYNLILYPMRRFLPNRNNATILGSSGIQWKSVYAVNFYENGKMLSSKYLPKATSGTWKVYGIDGSNTGATMMYAVNSNEAAANTLVQRNTGGVIVVGEPTADNHAATRKYVNDSITGLSNTYATKTAIDNKVDKITSTNTYDRAYVVKSTGIQGAIPIDVSGSQNTIAKRSSTGNLFTQKPTLDTHCANKQYVDDSISTALNSYIQSITLNGSTLTPTSNTIDLGNLALATHTHKSADITDSIPLIAGSNISLTSSSNGITIAATSQTDSCLKFNTTSSSYGGYTSIKSNAVVSPYIPMYFQKGVIIDSYSHDITLPGLMVQHISGITNVNTSTTLNHDRGPLYLNYDGDATYARPVVLGAASYGNTITKTTATSTTPNKNMGYTYSAIRGDQMVNYVQACLPNITLSTNGSAATKQQNIAFSLNGTELTITVS